MFIKFLLFFKISVFFLGLDLFISYLIHRVLFFIHSKSLQKRFPRAFDSCFKLVTEFYSTLNGASRQTVNRFLEQVISRKKVDLPKRFKDLPSKVVQSAYDMLVKFEMDSTNTDSETIVSSIRESIFRDYYQSYRREVLFESLNWFMAFIPIAFASGILLPLVFYFYYPIVLVLWPISLTLLGILLGVVTVIFIVKDYFWKR